MSIRGIPTILNHREAVRYFNQLILDLKKKEMGLEHKPITMERLEEGTRHIRDIAGCQQPARIYYRSVQQELRATDRLLAERNRVMEAIPPCPAHGNQCVPHALEWIDEQLSKEERENDTTRDV